MKLQNTNTNAFKTRVYRYLLDSGYDVETESMDDAQIAQFMFDKFNNEYNHPANLKRYPNEQDRLAQFLAGLPFNIAYSDTDIVETAEKLHEVPAGSIMDNDKLRQKIIEAWFTFMAFKMLQMFTHYKVNRNT